MGSVRLHVYTADLWGKSPRTVTWLWRLSCAKCHGESSDSSRAILFRAQRVDLMSVLEESQKIAKLRRIHRLGSMNMYAKCWIYLAVVEMTHSGLLAMLNENHFGSYMNACTKCHDNPSNSWLRHLLTSNASTLGTKDQCQDWVPLSMYHLCLISSY